MRLRCASVIAAALLTLVGCHGKASPSRIIILGIDGADPQTIDLLMSEGKLPNFAKLRREGAYSRFLSRKPLLSPVIWTTIATGKTPDQHHIGHFVTINQKTGERLPVTSQMRRVKALWNIFSDSGLPVGVVGWWASWPAESVRGTIVSDHTCYHFLFREGGTGASDAAGLVYPAALTSKFAGMVRRPDDLTREEIAPYVNVSDEEFARPFDFQNDLGEFKWALATAESYRKIGLNIWQNQRPELLMVYIEGVDSTSHLFGHLFRAQGLAGELAEQQKRFGGTVEAMYGYADRVLGDYIKAMGPETTLAVMSDHGFQLGVLQDDPSKTRDMRRVSERYHRMEGILYLYGNHVKPHARLDRPTIMDIAPTVLALGGLAPARDMPGRVLTEALDIRPPHRNVASYETGARVASGAKSDAPVDPAILEHLRALGYLDTESPTGERNLAAIYFQEHRYEESIKAYRKLLEKNPDDGTLHASLGGALAAAGRFDDALKELGAAIKLAPTNPEAYHNRGLIYEKRGRTQEAISDYRNALRYNAGYEPSRQALVRLTGTGNVSGPRTDAEHTAAAKAEQAAQAARRGDYAAAMKLLDEAETIAPRYALVYQYRANVAFLMRDKEAAAAALKKGLEIEPDNALFRTNLEKLQSAKPPVAKTAVKPRNAQPSVSK